MERLCTGRGPFASSGGGLISMQGHLKDLGKMQRLTPGRLRDLLPATEAVGDDQGIVGGIAYCGEQDSLATLDRYLGVLLVKAKRAGHPAAAAVKDRHIQAQLA